MKVYIDFEICHVTNGEVTLYMTVQHMKLPTFKMIKGTGMLFGKLAKLGDAHASAFRFRTLTNDGVK